MKISVIIPVYNAGKFIRKCLDSIVSQTFPEFEVICIDDGSTDDSSPILSEYASQYKNITVIRQKNMGQGPTRNRGVGLAVGKYIKFVDADDYLHPNALQILFETAEKTKVDIVVCKAFCVNETGDSISTLKMWNNLIGNYSKKDLSNIDFFNNACSPVLWDKLIKADIAKTCLSPALKRGQDFVTLIKYLALSNNVFFIDVILYYYWLHVSYVMATPESRETIMSDFTTEQLAIKIMRDYFQNTNAYSFYCERIQREWANRINVNNELLQNDDTALIESFIHQITKEILGKNDMLLYTSS